MTCCACTNVLPVPRSVSQLTVANEMIQGCKDGFMACERNLLTNVDALVKFDVGLPDINAYLRNQRWQTGVKVRKNADAHALFLLNDKKVNLNTTANVSILREDINGADFGPDNVDAYEWGGG